MLSLKLASRHGKLTTKGVSELQREVAINGYDKSLGKGCNADLFITQKNVTLGALVFYTSIGFPLLRPRSNWQNVLLFVSFFL